MTEDEHIETRESLGVSISEGKSFLNKLEPNILVDPKKNIDEAEPPILYQFFYATDD